MILDTNIHHVGDKVHGQKSKVKVLPDQTECYNGRCMRVYGLSICHFNRTLLLLVLNANGLCSQSISLQCLSSLPLNALIDSFLRLVVTYFIN